MCARAALLLLLGALVAADLDQGPDMSPVPFVMSSRYGRSSGPKMIVPRNDRFIMGARYGKRSEGGRAAGAGAAGLLCEFTGVFPLYRCVRHKPGLDRYDARSAEEAGTAEVE